MNNKKNIAKVGIVGAMLLGITECSMIVAPAATAEFTKPQTQILTIEKPLSVVDIIQEKAEFQRLDVEVITVAPWMKPETQSIVLSDSELISILKSVGFEGSALRMAWAIVQKESSARPYAHNDNASTGDDSYGLFQINMRGSMGPERMKKYNLSSKLDLFNPLTNAQIAYKMSSGGKNWNAWSAKDKAISILSSFPG
jgi:hypothetical protein